MNSSQPVSKFSAVFAVFPVQGSQQVGMAKDLYENFALVRHTFEEASESIHVNLKKLCFDGPESDLTLTENTQPCLLTASVAAYRVAEQELGFFPGAVAGHSLGEYSALVAARCLDLPSAVRWVRERGSAMQKAVPSGEGKMAAILGLEDAQVEQLCRKATEIALKKRESGESKTLSIPPLVEPANFNAPAQVVIAGSCDAIDEAIALIKSGKDFSGGKAIPLQVSAPFHCQLMKPARNRMVELFSNTSGERPKPLAFPYIPNRTGRLTQEAGLVFEFLIEQVDHPVLWKQSIQTLLDGSFQTAIEFGPGKVLTGLIKRIASSTNKNCNLGSVSDTASLKTLESQFQTLRSK